jgi:trehalose 6-phosphate synthase
MNRLVVVSNRVPDLAAGTQAGGLAVAIGGLLQRRGGLWFGWSGRTARDGTGKTVELASRGQVDYATIDLTPQEHQGYYTRFSNSVLWPLLHTLPELMVYNRRDAQIYREVNTRIADALVPLLRPTDLIWIHDYHLLPMPALLRARGVHNPIGFFLHIPFASADLIASVPDLPGMIKSMLAADLVGFQTAHDAENFSVAAQQLAGAVQPQRDCLQLGGRRTRISAFPVEIDAREFAQIATDAMHTASTERLRRSLGSQKLMLGVDRLDPTKGLLQRLAGLRRFLEKYPEWQRNATLLQIAAVSRHDVPSYRELRRELDRESGNLNGDLGDPDWVPLRLVAKAGPRHVLAGYMRRARVGLVTPLRDGMNLVAKEFVAAQDPHDPGVLVLSRFAGAARQLNGAVLVNPHDADEMADALHLALRMELPERQARWETMWRAIEGATSVGWGRAFLGALLRAAAHPELALTDAGGIRPATRSDLVERVRREMEPRRGPSSGTGAAVAPAGVARASLLRPH